jgi:DNA-damage-inducible protein J
MARMSLNFQIDDETLAEAEAAFAARGQTVEEAVRDHLRDVALDAMLERIPPGPPHLVCPPDRDFDDWVREKVQEALDDPRPPVPHEQVMAELDDLLNRLDRGEH